MRFDQVEAEFVKNLLLALDSATTEEPTNSAEEEKNEMWILATFDGIETPEGDQTAIDTVRSVLTSLASDLAVAFKDRNIDDLLDLIIPYLIAPSQGLYSAIWNYGSEKVSKFPTLGPDLIGLQQRHGVDRNYSATEQEWLNQSIKGSSFIQYASERFMGSVLNASSQLPRVKATIIDSIALKNSLKTAVLRQHNQGGLEKMQAGVAHLE